MEDPSEQEVDLANAKAARLDGQAASFSIGF
jgi:hypothetical protein